ncbi:Uncharacterised protein [Bordetella ansorpii]|uniref:Uncharacterized protein n=1 Tax=Bordetella ansorpii TaxID=288768 RepID=A0A157S6Q1_9BORD|nr:hypothetical protein [Bordetella ansorpii]SAI65923.1 Uncharacterised protein [Bordetella ansorpii]
MSTTAPGSAAAKSEAALVAVAITLAIASTPSKGDRSPENISVLFDAFSQKLRADANQTKAGNDPAAQARQALAQETAIALDNVRDLTISMLGLIRAPGKAS